MKPKKGEKGKWQTYCPKGKNHYCLANTDLINTDQSGSTYPATQTIITLGVERRGWMGVSDRASVYFIAAKYWSENQQCQHGCKAQDSLHNPENEIKLQVKISQP